MTAYSEFQLLFLLFERVDLKLDFANQFTAVLELVLDGVLLDLSVFRVQLALLADQVVEFLLERVLLGLHNVDLRVFFVYLRLQSR